MVSAKTRLRICLDGTEMVRTIAWYGAPNPESIEETIKKVFRHFFHSINQIIRHVDYLRDPRFY